MFWGIKLCIASLWIIRLCKQSHHVLRNLYVRPLRLMFARESSDLEGPLWSPVVMGTLARGWCHVIIVTEVWQCHALHHRPAINCHVSLRAGQCQCGGQPRVTADQWEGGIEARDQSEGGIHHPLLTRQSDTNLTAENAFYIWQWSSEYFIWHDGEVGMSWSYKCFILQPNYCNRPAGNQTNFSLQLQKGNRKTAWSVERVRKIIKHLLKE